MIARDDELELENLILVALENGMTRQELEQLCEQCHNTIAYASLPEEER